MLGSKAIPNARIIANSRCISKALKCKVPGTHPIFAVSQSGLRIPEHMRDTPFARVEEAAVRLSWTRQALKRTNKPKVRRWAERLLLHP